MNCPKCGLENPVGALFCMRCGKELTIEDGSEATGELFCYRHPKIPTQLSCGRCGRPVCTKCVVLGPAGPRCKECAKLNIPVRPGAVIYDAKRTVMSLFKSGPWTIYIWILLIGLVLGGVRGCMALVPQERHVPTHEDSPRPDSGRDM